MSPNALAPETLANGPDTLSWIFTILRALSATLLSQLTAVSSRHRRNWSASLRKRVARFQAFRWASLQRGRVADIHPVRRPVHRPAMTLRVHKGFQQHHTVPKGFFPIPGQTPFTQRENT